MSKNLRPALEDELTGILRDLAVAGAPGLGVDVEEHSRWRQGGLRLNALFTPTELARCQGLADPAAQLAGTWCAKEAAVKAMSPFVTVSLRDVEVVHDAAGRPAVRLLPSELRHHGERLRVSVGRTDGVSVAVAVYVPVEA